MLASPKFLLRLEGLLALVAATQFYRTTGESWGWFAALFFAPDLFMLGYFFGTRPGARIYNLGHAYTTPFLVWVALYFAQAPAARWVCLIWVAHIGFDRLLGYGLKYPTAFKDTHLGKV